MAALRWWNARLGEAIRSDSGGHGIAQVYPDLCSGDDLASGSSILPLAQENSHCAGLDAATRVVVTRRDDGNPAFNTSEFLGALLTSSLENSYYPSDDRSFGETMNRFSGALSSDAVSLRRI